MQTPTKIYAKLDNYTIIKTLGQGQSSKVKLALKDEKLYALKILRESFKQNPQRIQQFKREISTISQLKHVNIVGLRDEIKYGIYKKKDGKKIEVVYCAFEYCYGGEFFDFAEKNEGFDEITCRTFFKKVISIIEYIHQKGFCHRDIKLENFVFATKVSDIKLIDYGFCVQNDKYPDLKLWTTCGTKGYMSPEIIQKESYTGEQVDVFSAGVLLFIIYSWNLPFHLAHFQDDHYKYFFRNQKDRFWDVQNQCQKPGFFSEDFKDLINKMLECNPNKRISINQIKNHKWFLGKTLSDDELNEKYKDFNKEIQTKVAETQKEVEVITEQLELQQKFKQQLESKQKKTTLNINFLSKIQKFCKQK